MSIKTYAENAIWQSQIFSQEAGQNAWIDAQTEVTLKNLNVCNTYVQSQSNANTLVFSVPPEDDYIIVSDGLSNLYAVDTSVYSIQPSANILSDNTFSFVNSVSLSTYRYVQSFNNSGTLFAASYTATNPDRLYFYNLEKACNVATQHYLTYTDVGSSGALTFNFSTRDVSFSNTYIHVYPNIHQYNANSYMDSLVGINPTSNVFFPEVEVGSITYFSFPKPDGSMFWVSDYTGNVCMYNLTTNWDINTAIYDTTVNLATFPGGGYLSGLDIDPSGKNYVVSMQGSSSYHQLKSNTAYDLANAYYVSNTSVAYLIGGSNAGAIKLYPKLKKALSVDRGTASTSYLHELDMVEPIYDVYTVDISHLNLPSTPAFNKVYNKPLVDTNVICMSNANSAIQGSEFETITSNVNGFSLAYNNNEDNVFNVGDTVTSKYILDNAALTKYAQEVTGYDPSYTNHFCNNGKWLATTMFNSDDIVFAEFENSWDIYSFKTNYETYNLTTWTITSIYVKPDLTSVFLLDYDNTQLVEATFNVPGDFTEGFTLTAKIKNLTAGHRLGLTFASTGGYFYVTDTSSNIRRYTLTTPWDIATASFDQSLDLGTSSVPGMWFSDSGKNLLITLHNNTVRHYYLSTAWDLSTASLQKAVSTAGLGISGLSLSSINVSDNGRQLFLNTSDNKHLYEFAIGETNTITNLEVVGNTTHFTFSTPWTADPKTIENPVNRVNLPYINFVDNGSNVTALSNTVTISSNTKHLVIEHASTNYGTEIQIEKSQVNLWQANV